MLVCKEWHSIISATSDFWRVVDTTDSLELISLCLRRSRGSLIDVLLSLLPETEVELFSEQIQGLGGDAISLLVPHAACVRSLFIDLSPDDFFLVEPLFEEKLTALQNVSIMPVKVRLQPRRGLNPNLSRVMQPNLRSLAVRDVRLPPPSQFWHSLRVLKLLGFPDSLSAAMSARDILKVIKHNPSLEEIHLLAMNYMQESPDGTPSLMPSPKTHCPVLRTFVFYGPLELASDLISELRFPKDILHVDIRIVSPKERFERAFSDVVPRHSRFILERMSDVSFQIIPTYGCSSPICQFKLTSPSRRATRVVPDGTFTSIAFEYHRGVDHPDADPSLPLRCPTRVLAWTTVRHLRLVPLPNSTEADTYERFLASFPSLESLALCPFSVAGTQDLLLALQPERRESDGGLDIPRCPHLRALAIHEGTPGRDRDYELLAALHECVRVRAEAGSRLDEVDLHLYCYTYWPLGVHEHQEPRVLEVVGNWERTPGASRGSVGGRRGAWGAVVEGWAVLLLLGESNA
ncbi:hypothetical protein GSI_14406 [Ganoderma sinense ZZ0214-1]|uniref:F-box domain-containing protein n=1 Tax=Ganoderma sinense ZZ0214-1 TaxID=1077348 RepID=A0A2G8RP38_9APHY|nr:hypothetical protein GSI_14406 [Ganoderma sinense ZZ0214-1]